MGMKNEPTVNNFGKRLARFRKSSGLTQQQLGDRVGVSKRVIAYYEGETKYPPAHLVLPLAEALSVTTDELLGVTKTKRALDPKLAALWRRLKILETFSEKDRKAVLQFVDVIAERNRAQKVAGTKSV
jgi:transcriptional regulator with XRE-family HTH domain